MRRLVLALALIGCGRSGVPAPPASIGTTGTTSGTTQEACPRAAFEGSEGCYIPDSECCADVLHVDVIAHCVVATESRRPIPFLCTTVPETGTATDGWDCEPIETSNLGCQWGGSTILCCSAPP